MAETYRDEADAPIAAVLGLISLLTWAALAATTTSKEGDFFDSAGYWATWLAFPLVALLATAIRPTGRTALVAAASLVVPLMCILAFVGTVGHNPDDGASLWIVGEIILLFEALVVWFGALIGLVVGKARNRNSSAA